MWLTILDKMQSVSDYQQHQLLWTFFKEEQAAGYSRPFCYRDTGDQIIMLSNTEPSTSSKEVRFVVGQQLMFECRASLNKRRTMDRIIYPQDYTAEQTKDWIKRRLDGAATVDYVAYKSMPPHIVIKNNGHKMPLSQVLFFGTLTITDATLFDEKISTGIGQGGAFGFGAMMLPEVMK